MECQWVPGTRTMFARLCLIRVRAFDGHAEQKARPACAVLKQTCSARVTYRISRLTTAAHATSCGRRVLCCHLGTKIKTTHI